MELLDKTLNTVNYIKNFLLGEYNITKFNSNTNETICGFDSFMGIKYDSNSKVSTYTVQLGDFSSYNKVLIPTNIEIILATQGTYDKISSVLSTLENYKNSTELVNIQTPYGVFIGYNIINLTYELSTNRGLGYLECTIKARQIEVSDQQFIAYKNIEEQPVSLLGKMNKIQNILDIVEKITSTINYVVLGVEIITSNRINFK